MKNSGYIKLYRDILQHPVFSDPYLLKLFNYCLLKATHKERDYVMDNTVVHLMPGEFIWGRKVASEELNYKAPPKYKISESSWENKLKVLEKLGILTRKTNNRFTVVTIVNWGVYQGEDQQNSQRSEQQANSGLTTDKLRANTDKNVKNVEHVKNVVVNNNDNAFKDILSLYQQNIEMTPSQITIQKISDDFDRYGEELMKFAIEKSAINNNHNYRFIDFLLKDWRKKQLTTIEAVKQYEEHKANKPSQYASKYKTPAKEEYHSPYHDMEFITPDENDLPF